MAEGEPQETSVEEQLVQACQNGDASTLQTLMTSVPGLDLSLTTEDGATLITNAVIGAGQTVPFRRPLVIDDVYIHERFHHVYFEKIQQGRE